MVTKYCNNKLHKEKKNNSVYFFFHALPGKIISEDEVAITLPCSLAWSISFAYFKQHCILQDGKLVLLKINANTELNKFHFNE